MTSFIMMLPFLLLVVSSSYVFISVHGFGIQRNNNGFQYTQKRQEHFLVTLWHPPQKNNRLSFAHSKQSFGEARLYAIKHFEQRNQLRFCGVLSLSAIDSAIETQQQEKEPEIKSVQRKYETFIWKYRSGFVDDNMKMNESKDDVYYNINYRVEGPENGQPILLVHGFGANVNHFRFQFPTLVNEGYRVYAIDLIGFGASDKPISKPAYSSSVPFGYSIELFVAVIEDFIMYINNDTMKSQQQWHIAGNSIGGLCCINVAVNHPSLIRSITLFNCAGGMTAFRYEELPFLLHPILYFVQKVMLGPYFGSKFFKNFKSQSNVEQILKTQGVYCNTTNVNDELLEILLEPSNDNGAESVFLQVFGGPPGPTPEEFLPNVSCPIIALWGENDPWTPYDGGMHPGTGLANFVSNTTNFTLQVLPNTGHCPHDENPTGVHQYMIPFLKSCS
jgi:pimeloyl-ACP methyl ester carboxylesterase